MKNNITKKIEELKEKQNITRKTIDKIKEWWAENEEVIGRKIGKYKIKRLKYSNAYNGCYDDEIVIKENSEESYILGYGYYGFASGNDHNSFEMEKANREQHKEFFQNFQKELEKKLKKSIEKETEINEAITNLKSIL